MAFLSRYNRFLGLYATGQQLYFASLKRGWLKWLPGEPLIDGAACGVWADGSPLGLRHFLDRLVPRTRQAIYLALPRRFFYFRHLDLPPMPLEDALMSVETSLSVSCHLPVDEIFYDIHLCPLASRRIHGLLIYARRQEISPFLDAFCDTGHRNSLCGLQPYIVGLGAWLSSKGYSLPLGVVCGVGDEWEVAICNATGTAYTVAAGELEFKALKRKVHGRYPEIGERFYLYMAGEQDTLPPPPKDKLTFLPPVEENPAVVALGPPLAGQQAVCIDERPVKLNRLHPASVMFAAALVLVFICGVLTWSTGFYNRRLEKKVQAIQAENRKLEQRLKPLRKKQQLSKKSAAILKDIDDFIHQRPRMYSCLNEIAKRLPDGTWFTSLNFRKNTLTLRGESPDALKVVEALRQSEFFSQVKLQGTVSKTRTQQERFSLVLQLRKGKDEPVKNK